MTPEQLKSIAARVASSRYWLHWNYPAEPVRMAIGVLGYPCPDGLDEELAELGFVREEREGFNVWSIERVD